MNEPIGKRQRERRARNCVITGGRSKRKRELLERELAAYRGRHAPIFEFVFDIKRALRVGQARLDKLVNKIGWIDGYTYGIAITQFDEVAALGRAVLVKDLSEAALTRHERELGRLIRYLERQRRAIAEWASGQTSCRDKLPEE